MGSGAEELGLAWGRGVLTGENLLRTGAGISPQTCFISTKKTHFPPKLHLCFFSAFLLIL